MLLPTPKHRDMATRAMGGVAMPYVGRRGDTVATITISSLWACPPQHTHSLALSLVAGFVAYIKPSMRNVRRNAHRNPTTHTSPSSSRLAQTRVASRRGARTYRQREAVEVPLALPPVPPGKAGELEAARAGEDDEQSVDDRRDPDAVVRHAWELRAVPGSVHGVQAQSPNRRMRKYSLKA